MSVLTPARIAVLGAGPIGLEAALYARFLGYDVDVYDRGPVGGNIRQWGHVRLFTPFAMNRTRLALAALECQGVADRLPGDDELLTGQEYVDRFLVPLAKSDLLAGNVHERTEVLSVGRASQQKGDRVGSPRRGDDDFRLLLREVRGGEEVARSKSSSPHPAAEPPPSPGGRGKERFARADVVIDASGTFGNANWLGRGGIPALGERGLRRQIEYGLPDVAAQREQYAGKRVLVIGAGYSAATNLVALAELPETKITWATRRRDMPPVRRFENDRLPQRDRLAVAANELARSGRVAHWPSTVVIGVRRRREPGTFRVRLAGRHRGTIEVDRIVANVGYRPDLNVFRELHAHTCYAGEGPLKLAAALLAETSADCLDQTSRGPQTLLTPEPDFYVLGSKSYGRNSNFLLSVGYDQIRELFTIIGDRADLNLYETVGPVGK